MTANDMKRNTAIDMAKGIAICLMVIGHCYCKENPVLTVIYAFHMPFFFIISGMLYSAKWREKVNINIKKTCLKLLIPYFVFEILFKLFLLILQRPDDFLENLCNTLFKTILPLHGITVTWFLPCQLIVYILAASVLMIIPQKYSQYAVVIFTVLFLLGLIFPINEAYIVVLMRALIGVGFFAIGYYGRILFEKKVNLIVLLISFSAFIGLAITNGMLSLVNMNLSNPILYVINGALGSYILFQCCLRMKENRLTKGIAYLGKNTIIILCTHMFAVEAIRLLDYKLFNNILHCFGFFEGFVFGGIVIAVMCLLIPLCNRYFWFLFGHARSK